MSNSAVAELYFIGAMMILILILSVASVYFFMRQYRREMREKAARTAKLEEQAERKTQAADLVD